MNVFFNKTFYNVINDFDWYSDGPMIIGYNDLKNQKSPYVYIKWVDYIMEELQEIEEQLNSYFEKYSYWMTDEMLKNYSRLIDVKFYKNIKYNYDNENAFKGIHTRIRFTIITGLNISKIIKIAIWSNKYNSEYFNDIEKLVAKGTLMENNFAPKVNSATIKQSEFSLYMTSDDTFYEKYIKNN